MHTCQNTFLFQKSALKLLIHFENQNKGGIRIIIYLSFKSFVFSVLENYHIPYTLWGWNFYYTVYTF